MSEQNPFFSVSLLPYQAPPFDLIQDCHYRPAFDEGIRQQRAEIREVFGVGPTDDSTSPKEILANA